MPIQMDEYIYTPLNGSDEFRLVLLDQSETDPSTGALLSIEFVLARFDREYSYAALSYVWDEYVGEEYIPVKGIHPGKLKIKKNLACALQSLRESEHQFFWIDALCIDQNNLQEKNHQVGRMAEIYRRATEVVIWLGEATSDSDAAMEFVMNISTRDIDKLATDPESSQAWRALANLMQRSWFTRRWVIQEVGFARHAVLRCGSASVSWIRFCSAVELFTEKLDEISLNQPLVQDSKSWPELLSLLGLTATSIFAPAAVIFTHAAVAVASAAAASDYGSITPYIGELRGVGVHALITVCDRVLSRKRNDDEPHRLCTMEALLSYLAEFETTNGCDVVFALASLAKDYMGFTPDYGQSVVRVYKNAIQQAVATSRSLNIICRPWAQSSTNLPSWILPRSILPFRQNDQGSYVRQYADTLVSSPHHRTYHASGDACASVLFNDDETRFILSCRGFQLPDISWIGERAANGSIPNSWYSSIKGHIEQKYWDEMYWRTLVVDRDSRGNPPPHWYSLAYNDAYRLCSDGGLDAKNLLQKQRNDGEQISSKLKEFLERVQAVTWDRRLVRLVDDSLGLVPERTSQYDRICILFGCDVPVVLRRLKGGFWEFIGEAFVYGVMDGEAIERHHKDRDFKLV